jgi:hypothetical protein
VTEACRFGLFTTEALPHIRSIGLTFPEPIKWGEDELEPVFDSSDGNGYRCGGCDEHVPEDDYYSTHDSILCHDCFHEDYIYCYNCGEVENKEDASYVQHELFSGDKVFCTDCYEAWKDRQEEDKESGGCSGNPQKSMIDKMREKYKGEVCKGRP